jgi:hypothetical protein
MNYLNEYMEYSVIVKHEEQEALLKMAVNETNALLGKYNLQELAILQEANFADGVKDKWKKLIDKLKELWAKFLDRMQSVFMKKIDWLAKHEDAIRKPVKIDLVYDMYPYYPDGFKEMETFPDIPVFDFEQMKNNGALKDDSSFLTHAKWSALMDKNRHYSQMASLLFKGGKNMDVERIDFKDKSMWEYYQYCKKAITQVESIKKEKDRLETALKKIAEIASNAGYEKDKEKLEKKAQGESVTEVGSVLFENTIYINNEKFGYDYLDTVEANIVDRFKMVVTDLMQDHESAVNQLGNLYERIVAACIIDNIPSFEFERETFYMVSFNTVYCILNFIIQQVGKYPNDNYVKNMISISHKNVFRHMIGNDIVSNLINRLTDDYNRMVYGDTDTSYILNNILSESKKEVTNNFDKLSKEEAKLLRTIEHQYSKRVKDEKTAGEIAELIGKVAQAVLVGAPTVILGVTLTLSFIGGITILGLLAGLLLAVTDVGIAVNVILINNSVAAINKLKPKAKNVRESQMIDNIITKLSPKRKSFKESYSELSIARVLLEADPQDKPNDEPKGNEQPKEVPIDTKDNKNTVDQIKSINTKEKVIEVVDSSEDVKLVTRYQEICSAVLTAKMTALDEGVKTYLAILEKHVRSYIGNDKIDKDGVGNNGGKRQEPDMPKDGITQQEVTVEENGKKIVKTRITHYANGKAINSKDVYSDDQLKAITKYYAKNGNINVPEPTQEKDKSFLQKLMKR